MIKILNIIQKFITILNRDKSISYPPIVTKVYFQYTTIKSDISIIMSIPCKIDFLDDFEGGFLFFKKIRNNL